MTATAAKLVSDECKTLFREQGFFASDVLFGEDEMAAMYDEFLRIWQRHLDALQGADAKTLERARYRPFGLSQLDKSSAQCAAFCRHPVLLQLCREMVGPDCDMTWNQVIIKPPAPIDNSFGWHQDMYYAVHGGYGDDCNQELFLSPDTPGFTAWIAITRTTVDNGTLWVLPGRHREGLLPHVWNEERDDWQGQFDTAWKVPAVLRPGQAMIFHKYLPHGSGPNLSQETRVAYQLGFCVPGVKLGESIDIIPLLRNGVAVS